MLGLNQMKKFIYLGVFLVSLSFTSFAQGNAEISAHFGMKFGSKLNLQEIVHPNHLNDYSDQDNMPFNLGADILYRHMMSDSGSFGVGARYRWAFIGERDFDHVGNNENDKYKFNHHRVALLLNYRFHMDSFFVGPVLGIDIWKHLRFAYIGGAAAGDRTTEFHSSQFLWDQITGQLGLELGYKATDNFFVKLEAGYDLSRFNDLECKTGLGDSNVQDCESGSTGAPNPLLGTFDGDDFESETLKLNAFYVTLGIGWFFG